MRRGPVVFYVSDHGFGHASRQIEVINAFAARRPDVPIAVRTRAAPWLFRLTLRAGVSSAPVACDTGIVQIDSLRLDAAATIERAAAFYGDLDAAARREAASLGAMDARFVVVDAPPLGCLAAHLAGVPSTVLANFTWDWIYEEYEAQIARVPWLVPRLREAYATAPEAWRLPMWGGFGAIPDVLDLPLIARRSSVDPTFVRRSLGLPEAARLVLLSFGGYGVEGLNEGALRLAGYEIVTTISPHEPVGTGGLRDAHRVDEQGLYAAGLRYEDLIRAVDVVLTKPGYGIIAECAANDTALLYTSRGRFREYEVLVREMPKYVRCRHLAQDDLFGGRWQEALDALLDRRPPRRPAVDGAEVAAGLIAERLERTV